MIELKVVVGILAEPQLGRYPIGHAAGKRLRSHDPGEQVDTI
jgi:hypothetical protein